ncbi:MAG: iron-sulfur cluster assembly scaffold protein [Kiritimatiellae bacterium]|nr:iron-sulfur cluster assembly scaffold protein [Kiritimatiellia bacterium]
MTQEDIPRIDAFLSDRQQAGNGYFGRMNDPTAAAILQGPCGDEMEFYLYIEDGVIRDAKYHTRGCLHTRICGRAVAERAKGRSVEDALAINPKEILDSGQCVPEEGRHCAILAVSTLYRAIADYLLRP